MIRKKIESSSIESIGYFRGSETLEIEFKNGSIYQYFGVPIDEYWRLMQADSKGSYFAENIKDEYNYTKIRD